jgi:hypothetical protein
VNSMKAKRVGRRGSPQMRTSTTWGGVGVGGGGGGGAAGASGASVHSPQQPACAAQPRHCSRQRAQQQPRRRASPARPALALKWQHPPTASTTPTAPTSPQSRKNSAICSSVICSRVSVERGVGDWRWIRGRALADQAAQRSACCSGRHARRSEARQRRRASGVGRWRAGNEQAQA